MTVMQVSHSSLGVPPVGPSEPFTKFGIGSNLEVEQHSGGGLLNEAPATRKSLGRFLCVRVLTTAGDQEPMGGMRFSAG